MTTPVSSSPRDNRCNICLMAFRSLYMKTLFYTTRLTLHRSFFKDFIYLLLERGEGKEKERERNINVWLTLVLPLLGTWPETQAWALTGNRTSDLLIHWCSIH